MNKRIKELAKQAGGNPNYKAFRGHFLPPPPDYIDPATVDLEKFAELIVRECAELIDNKVTITAAQTYDEVFVARYDTKEQCAQQIKQHFGVEE